MSSGLPRLFTAALVRNTGLVTEYIEAGDDVNENYNGWNVLHLLLYSGGILESER